MRRILVTNLTHSGHCALSNRLVQGLWICYCCNIPLSQSGQSSRGIAANVGSLVESSECQHCRPHCYQFPVLGRGARWNEGNGRRFREGLGWTVAQVPQRVCISNPARQHLNASTKISSPIAKCTRFCIKEKGGILIPECQPRCWPLTCVPNWRDGHGTKVNFCFSRVMQFVEMAITGLRRLRSIFVCTKEGLV
jgi:hypothetical protein